MARKRVLLVDDSVVIRKFLSDLIDAEPSLEVAGAAPNGEVALTKIAMAAPDVVILDIEMPVMNGLDTLRAIKKERPGLPVIMFSSTTTSGADQTAEALRHGAAGYVTKPSDADDRELAGAELVKRILAITRGGATAARAAGSAPATGGTARPPASRAAREPVARRVVDHPPARKPNRGMSMGKVDVLAIGASTGGQTPSRTCSQRFHRRRPCRS